MHKGLDTEQNTYRDVEKYMGTYIHIYLVVETNK